MTEIKVLARRISAGIFILQTAFKVGQDLQELWRKVVANTALIVQRAC